MTEIASDRIRKSVQLGTDEYKALAKWVKAQPTKIDAAFIIGISRQALDNILIKRSGSQESVEKIKKVLGTASDRREEEKATA